MLVNGLGVKVVFDKHVMHISDAENGVIIGISS